MRIGEIDFPEDIINAIRDHRLVIFAGTGVSMGEPACLPSFEKLAQEIAQRSNIEKGANEPEDRFIGRLQNKGITVHKIAHSLLSDSDLKPTELHKDLLRIFRQPDQVRIVTTNFDILFQRAVEELGWPLPRVYIAPALPLGRDFKGIIHVHGSVNEPESTVLTDIDFGRAYLTEGWARRFLIDLFLNYTVLFVGYSHNDTVMQYLARALPANDMKKRYALCPSGKEAHWEFLGIETIAFPQSDDLDFSKLDDGVLRLAEHLNRGALAWKREIGQIAENEPPMDLESISILKHTFTDIILTRFFVDSARSISWVRWLDEQKLLNALFSHESLDEINKLLAQWLAKEYAVQNSSEIMLLIGKFGNQINPFFWRELCHSISENKDIDSECFFRWSEVLLDTLPTPCWEYSLKLLAECASKFSNHRLCVKIFQSMLQWKIITKPSLSFLFSPENGDSFKDSEAKIEVVLDSYFDNGSIAEIWEEHLREHLDKVAVPLISILIQDLERRHNVRVHFGTGDHKYDSDCFLRAAIEPNSQDSFNKLVDVQIDVARDCLDFIAKTNMPKCLCVCQDMIESSSPLLRRLAIYTYSKLESKSSDEKLLWLLANAEIHDVSAHHEVFTFLSLTFHGASEDIKKTLVDKILSYEWTKNGDEGEDRTARHHFDFLHWLNKSCPNCDMVTGPLKKIQEKYPQWEISSNPDLLLCTEEMRCIEEISPWSSEELLAKDPADWIEKLLSFKGDVISDINRSGLVNAVSEATRENANWGCGLADELRKGKNWKSDLWRGLFKAWTQWPDEELKAEQILSQLSHEELFNIHARDISEVIYGFVKEDKKSYVLELLPKLNCIAEQLFQKLGQYDSEVDLIVDWFTTAINQPSGILTQYYIKSLSQWINQDDYTHTKRFPVEYTSWFDVVVKDKSRSGGCARAILTQQLPFLLHVDRERCIKKLFPLFKSPEPDIFSQVWDGFLYCRRLTPDIFDNLKDAFLEATQRMHSGFGENTRQFIEYYTGCCVFHVQNPLEEWIPKFFSSAKPDEISIFANSMGRFLEKFEENERSDCWNRWLKQHWENRLHNIPVPMGDDESGIMLGWTLNLPEVFPEAVSLAVEMQYCNLQYSSVIHKLAKSVLPEQHPEAVGKLLLYLLNLDAPRRIYYRINETIKKAMEAGLSPELKKELHEALLNKGFNDSIFTT